MNDVNIVIGRNIFLQRKYLGLTQDEFADKVSALYGKSIQRSYVSKIEHGEADISVSLLRAICSALNCSSYVLYPSSDIYSNIDVRLLDSIKRKSPRTKRILDYMINSWPGDDDAFWEFGLMYAVLDAQDRKYIADVGVEQYLDVKRNYPDSIDEADGLDVDIDLIKRAAKKLDK